MDKLFKYIFLALSFCLIREVKFFEVLNKLLKYHDATILVFWFIVYFIALTTIISWLEDLFEKL